MRSAKKKDLPELTLPSLREEARRFAEIESGHDEPVMYGVTDGKAVGTYVEQKFKNDLLEKYSFELGSAAKGIDFPTLNVDLKATSVKQPQSSCPFKSARQKIFGLGYAVLVFVYAKKDDPKTATARLSIKHTIFVDEHRTADYQTTSGLRNLLANNANEDDIFAFLQERNLPVDEIEAFKIAKELLKKPPELGYLTVSNALQWRLQYSRIIAEAGQVDGILRIYP